MRFVRLFPPVFIATSSPMYIGDPEPSGCFAGISFADGLQAPAAGFFPLSAYGRMRYAAADSLRPKKCAYCYRTEHQEVTFFNFQFWVRRFLNS